MAEDGQRAQNQKELGTLSAELLHLRTFRDRIEDKNSNSHNRLYCLGFGGLGFRV